MTDLLLKGWAEIAPALGMSVSQAIKKKFDLEQAKVIFYQLADRPPRPRVFAYQSRIKEYVYGEREGE